jgi:hypothetical protein
MWRRVVRSNLLVQTSTSEVMLVCFQEYTGEVMRWCCCVGRQHLQHGLALTKEGCVKHTKSIDITNMHASIIGTLQPQWSWNFEWQALTSMAHWQYFAVWKSNFTFHERPPYPRRLMSCLCGGRPAPKLEEVDCAFDYFAQVGPAPRGAACIFTWCQLY